MKLAGSSPGRRAQGTALQGREGLKASIRNTKETLIF